MLTKNVKVKPEATNKDRTFLIFSCGDWAKIKKSPTPEEACTRIVEGLSSEDISQIPIGLEMFAIDISNVSKSKKKNRDIFSMPSSYCFADAGKHNIAKFYHNQYRKKFHE